MLTSSDFVTHVQYKSMEETTALGVSEQYVCSFLGFSNVNKYKYIIHAHKQRMISEQVQIQIYRLGVAFYTQRSM